MNPGANSEEFSPITDRANMEILLSCMNANWFYFMVYILIPYQYFIENQTIFK